jgi:hypothetical protein
LKYKKLRFVYQNKTVYQQVVCNKSQHVTLQVRTAHLTYHHKHMQADAQSLGCKTNQFILCWIFDRLCLYSFNWKLYSVHFNSKIKGSQPYWQIFMPLVGFHMQVAFKRSVTLRAGCVRPLSASILLVVPNFLPDKYFDRTESCKKVGCDLFRSRKWQAVGYNLLRTSLFVLPTK